MVKHEHKTGVPSRIIPNMFNGIRCFSLIIMTTC